MPNEERVRTKRRKLDSIISKLHQTTEVSSKAQDGPLGENESENQASHREEQKILPRTSRRKLQTAVKQKKVENFSDDKDNTTTILSVEGDNDELVNGDDREAGIQVLDTRCNGDNNPEVQISEDVSGIKEEPVENSLAGLEQMLGYSISEEVEKQQGDNKKAKQKRKISDSSDDLDDKATNELPKRVQCTTCGREVNPVHGTICRHQSLNVLVCKKCSQYYNSGPFTRDEFGVEEQCHWCGDGGSLLCCDKCEKAFCKRCVKRNLGKTLLKAIVQAPGDTEWLCFSCNPKPLLKLMRKCNQIMDILETLKAQKTIFKTKRGPSIVGVPNQNERRNRLNSLSENIGLTSGAILGSSGESPTKRNFPSVGDQDRQERTHQSDDDVRTQQGDKKLRSKRKKSKPKEMVSSKQQVLGITDDDNDGDDVSDEDHTLSNVNNKKEKHHLNHRTKKDTKVTSNSVDKKGNTSNRKNVRNKKRKTRNQSDESDSDQKKIRSKPKKKADKVLFHSSDDDSDFVSMVKGKGIEASREKEPRSRKFKIKPPAISDSEETSEEGSKEQRRNRTSQRVVSQKQTRKRRRKVTSSDSESEVSNDKSDSDVPRRRKKKGKKENERVTAESDKESEQHFAMRKKVKRKRRKLRSSSESDNDTSKNKRKGKEKGKQKRKRRKHYIERDSNESEKSDHNEEAGNEEEISPSKQKGRRQIRKLIEDGKLAEETRKARRLEEERRKRLLERTQNNEDDLPGESSKVSKLVLESDPTTKEPTVEVKGDLVQHLKPHQSKGVQFMYDCVIESIKSWKKGEPGGGCILAHCMGLGKTLQVVSLVHTLMNHKEISMMTVLVVAPINTVLNWQVEFEKWLSVDDRLEVYILQEVAGNNWRRADMLKHWVRYGGIMIMGYSLYRNLSQSFRIRSKNQKKIFQEALVDPGPDLVICDEGHILRNDGSAISRALNAIKTRRRIVLTGTPLQNNLIEYHCMVSFVKPNLLGTRKEFTNTFVNPIQNGQCADSTLLDVQLMKQRCHVLHKTLEGCVQRKDYSALTPFLPRKHEYVIKVRLSVAQKKLYEHFLKTFVFPEGDLGKRGVSLFSDYQALMRIWTHPWCFKLEALRRPEKFVDSDSLDDFVVYTDEEEEEEEEVESVKSTTTEEESELESSSDEDDDRARRRKRRGASKRQDPNTDSDDENGSKSEEDEEENEEKSDEDVLGTKVKTSPTSVMNIDGEDITVVEINDSTVKSHEKPKREGRKDKREEDKNDSEKSKDALGDNTAIQNGETNAYGSTRSGTCFKDGPSDVEIVEEKEWYDEFLQEEDEYNVELSGKLVLLMEILADAEAVGDKVLVFSQSLVTLDLIEKVLGGGEIGGDRENWCRGCDYFRMDGSTSASLRQRWADSFNDKDNNNARLFLISTRAGGLGINLVAANRVIVFDVSWNPSHDVQSIFRVYRFGQAKAVYVYRFIAQGTMEEKIYDRQVTKLSMSGRVIDEQQIERHFTAADLRELYSFAPDMLDEEKEKEAEMEAQERPTLPLPKDAVLADLINRLHPKWIVNYLEHDSLLQNIESEELTEEEMKAAWEAYEAEKSGLTMGNAARRQGPPQENYAQTQQNVAERIRINTEMLRQIQQIRQLQEIQQRQELEERVQRIRREREQLYQRQRQALIQQHQRQQDERRRQNELRFIQHMTQQPVQQLQLAQPLSIQPPHQAAAATATSQGSAYNQPRITYQPVRLQFTSLPPLLPPSVPMATSSSITPSASNLTQTPTTQVAVVSQLPVGAQTAPTTYVRPPAL